MSKETKLAQCRGYRVETHDGRIGSVAAVLPHAAEGGALLVHSGLMSCTLSAVPFYEVETVDADRRRVLLREMPETMREGAPSGARDRIGSYGETAEAAGALLTGIEQALAGEDARDPQQVADAIVALVETPAGQRPLHTVVGDVSAAKGINEAAEPHARTVLESLGLGHLASGPPSGR
jgi:hypothetical protein